MNKAYAKVGVFLCVCVIAGMISPAAGQVTLEGDTSLPQYSAYIAGQPVELVFTVKGIPPKDATLSLHLTIVDEQENVIEEKDLPVQADEKGEWVGKTPGPNAKLGFYRVYAKLSNGVTIPKLVSRPEGYITYCIAPDPAGRKNYPPDETFFGMYGGCWNGYLDPYIGSHWKIGIWDWGWGNLDKTAPGQCVQTFQQAQEALDKARAEMNSSTWTSYTIPAMYIIPWQWSELPFVKETAGGYTATLTPEGEKHWAEYCRRAGAAFAKQNPEWKEHYYQITWEPIPPWGFKGTAEDIVRIHEIAYTALHEVDPKAVVVGPTTCNIQNDIEWTDQLFQKGLGKYIDGFCLHPYSPMPPEPNHMRECILDLKDMIRRYTGKDLPMFSTEQGFATGELKENELLQARGLVRSNLILKGEGFRMNIAFYIHDYLCELGYGFFYNLNPKIDYGTDKVGPKPIVPAYAAMTYLLEGHSSAGVIDWLGGNNLGYAFERGDEIVLALWEYGDTPCAVSIPVGVSDVKMYDWMGNAQPATVENGVLRVTLKPEPVYIVGAAANLWSATATKPIQLKENRIKAYPGSVVMICGEATSATGEAFTGELTLNSDEKLRLDVQKKTIAVQPGQKEQFAYSVRLPAGIAPGTYPMSLLLSSTEGKPVAAASCMVNVQPPLVITSVAPFLSPQRQPGLRVSVAELRGRAVEGSLRISLKDVPDSTQLQAIPLAANEQKTVEIVYDNIKVSPIQTYQADVTLMTKTGYSTTAVAPVNFFPAEKFAHAPAVDGDLSEWKAIPPTVLEGQARLTRSPQFYSGNDDLRVEFRYAWDDKALYLTVDATDDAYFQDKTGFWTWMGDSVQLSFDLDPRKKESFTGNELADKASRHRTSEITLSLTAQGPEAYRTVSYDTAKLPIAQLLSTDLPLTVKRQGNRIVYEAAIPWTTLGGDGPPSDRLLGFAISINDRDEAAQADPSGLGIFHLKDSKQFGTMILVPNNPPVEK